MITDNKNTLQIFQKYFNSRLAVIDMVLFCKKWKNGFNPLTRNCIVLQTNKEQIFNQLAEHNYLDLILSVIQNIEIETSCRDIYFSHLDENALIFFEEFIMKHRKECTASIKDNLFIIETYDLLADLLLLPLSQLHSEILNTYNHFNGILDVLDGDVNRIFLNANTATAFSYFIQIWVCENLGIPLAQNNNNNSITAVI